LPQPVADEEPEEDLGEDLVRRLREYRRFKEAAAMLQGIEETGLRTYPRLAPPSDLPLPTGLSDMTLDLMAQIFRDVLQRKPEEEPQGIVERREVTVEEKVELLTERTQGRRKLSFRAFISECRSRVEVIVSFMAVLELIKALQISVEQDVAFGDISLVGITPPIANS
jgi:segregation and condensation protein A